MREGMIESDSINEMLRETDAAAEEEEEDAK